MGNVDRAAPPLQAAGPDDVCPSYACLELFSTACVWGVRPWPLAWPHGVPSQQRRKEELPNLRRKPGGTVSLT
jgi:hypothetical protein